MHKFFRYCYLNTYSFLLLSLSCIIAALPIYKISVWLLIPQGFLFLYVFVQSIKLFFTWSDKKLKYKILMGKNEKEFRPDTFKQFMQMPCGRLLTKVVLNDLSMKEKYKDLLIYKEPFFVSLKNSFKIQETKIYINEDYK